MLRTRLMYCLVIALLLGFPLALYLLYRSTCVSPKDAAYILVTYLGWVIALAMLWFQLRKTREYNQSVKREEIRRSLEIRAVESINRALTDLSGAISKAIIRCMTLRDKPDLHERRILTFTPDEVAAELMQLDLDVLGGNARFALAVEANQIAVMQFERLRACIHPEIDRALEDLRQLRMYLMDKPIDELLKPEGRIGLKQRCDGVVDALNAVQCLLVDYRIALINGLFGDLFNSRVPERKPLDPRFRTLSQAADERESSRPPDPPDGHG